MTKEYMGHGDRFLVPFFVLTPRKGKRQNFLKGWDKEPVPVSHYLISCRMSGSTSVSLENVVT